MKSVFEVDPTLIVAVVPCSDLPVDQAMAALPDAACFETLPIAGNEVLHQEACLFALRVLSPHAAGVALIDHEACKIVVGAKQSTGQVQFCQHWVCVRLVKPPAQRPVVIGEAFCRGGVC